MKKKLIIVAIAASATLGLVPAVAGASGNAYGKVAQSCAEASGYSSIGAVARAGVAYHGSAKGGVPTALAAHCAG